MVDCSVIFSTELSAFPMQKNMAETNPTTDAAKASDVCSVMECLTLAVCGGVAVRHDQPVRFLMTEDTSRIAAHDIFKVCLAAGNSLKIVLQLRF